MGTTRSSSRAEFVSGVKDHEEERTHGLQSREGMVEGLYPWVRFEEGRLDICNRSHWDRRGYHNHCTTLYLRGKNNVLMGAVQALAKTLPMVNLWN